MTVTSPEASAGNDTARAVFAGLPRRYDRLAYLLSFGQDRRWRDAVVETLASEGPARVLDVATGPAGVAIATVRRTGASVVGVDLNEPMLREGLRNARRAELGGRIALVAGQAERLPFSDGSFDAVSFSYLLRYVDDAAATLTEMARCLRPGGVMASLEFAVPPRRPWRALWRLYTAVVLPTAGALTGGRAWWRVGRFLGPSIRDHYARMSLEDHVRAWEQAGLHDVRWRLMSVGGGVVMSGRKADAW
jgi:demethylmenaquinone methyltransferase / 2-methoxy-6-polyprenyl-1,4-benzoquinol methylase